MTTAAPTAEKLTLPTRRSPLLTFWLRFRRNKVAMVALAFVLFEVVVAILAPWIAPYEPTHQDYTATWEPPSGKHWFGTDDLGRDVLSRLMIGARVSISVGVLAQIAQLAIGLPIGAITGLKGGWFDFVFMRLVDILSSVPTVLFYMLMVIVLGRGFINIILAMSITGWIGIARLVRGQVLSLKATDYVRAAEGMGASTSHVIRYHLIRNALTPVIVSVTLGVPGSMMGEAGLSFLGLGITPPLTSWGQMMGLYQAYIQSAWHLTVFPALVLSLTMLAWIQLGDGLRNALDPTIRI
jgi:ABC-type dipeptide/oligopeptide/nickel transport system permease subunit